MKIFHICLSCFYIDGFNYQENELVRQHVSEGHDVIVIASTETIENGHITYTEPCDKIGTEGARVIRLPYAGWLPHKIMRKLRIHPDLSKLLEEHKPDTILFHGIGGFEIVTVAQYACKNPEALFYADSHTYWGNSAKNFVSREILHKLYYRWCLKRALPYIQKILCVSTEIMDFAKDVYKVPAQMLEFYPLGGTLIDHEDYAVQRQQTREMLGLASDAIMCLQSGKQTVRKKLIETLEAFARWQDPRARLFIAGILNDNIKDQAEALIKADDRVVFLGWKNAFELTDLLCATDLYLQPGTQSVTMQHSLCCHCAVVIDDVPAHRAYDQGIGWLISDKQSLDDVFRAASNADLTLIGAKSYNVAQSMLDYRVLSQRILRPDKI